MHLTLEEGEKVVALARGTLDSFVKTGKYEKAAASGAFLAEKRGVFVTLSLVEGGEKTLRGCIGYPYPSKLLAEGVQEAAVLAASDDPRFPPVVADELENMVVEVSVLSVPAELKLKDRKVLPSKVKVGEDGLVISAEFAGGLLLPQVATEQGWDSEEFLSQACLKAGMSPDSWLLPSTRVETFQADVFSEMSPRGAVEQVSLPVS